MENNFESKIRELEVIVKELEIGEVNLDDAIDKYTKAMKLAKECSDKLNKATEKVNKILKVVTLKVMKCHLQVALEGRY